MTSHTRQRLEREHGIPFEQLLCEVATWGVSQPEAASRLGVNYKTLSRWCRERGIVWSKGGRVRGLYRRWERDATRRVTVDGESLSISEAARRKGLDPRVVHQRWCQGDRTADRLLRPAYGPGPQRSTYELGLTVREWELIADYAAARGVDAAAQKFRVPRPAIRSVMSGQWERVA